MVIALAKTIAIQILPKAQTILHKPDSSGSDSSSEIVNGGAAVSEKH
jgi:hypothetical protein